MNEIQLYNQAEISADWETIDGNIDRLIEPFKGISLEDVAVMPIKELKPIRAELNRISGELDNARKAIKKEYTAPLTAFEEEVKKRIVRIQEPNLLIKEAISVKESKAKEEKRNELEEHYMCFAGYIYDMVSFDKILDHKWLNATFNIEKAKNEIESKIESVTEDWKTLKAIELYDREKAESCFFETLSLNYAVMQDRKNKEDAEKIKAFNDAIGSQEKREESVFLDNKAKNQYAFVSTLTEEQAHSVITLLNNYSPGSKQFNVDIEKDFIKLKELIGD